MNSAKKSKSADIKDSEKDNQKLKSETAIIDMPEVKDIPGQEHVVPPQFLEMQDVTISSADEEGEGILDDLNTEDQTIITNSSDVTNEEKKLLKKSAGHQPTDETKDFNDMVLDESDNDGESLNEKSIKQDRSGGDMDMPLADPEDDDENISNRAKKIIFIAKGLDD